MTLSQKKKCHGIIHGVAIGGGLAQIPGSDAPALVAVQTAMIISIGSGVFGQSVTKSMAGAFLADALGVNVGRTVSQILVGWIPGIGNGVNATTAAGLTEAIGWAAAKAFDKGEF